MGKEQTISQDEILGMTVSASRVLLESHNGKKKMPPLVFHKKHVLCSGCVGISPCNRRCALFTHQRNDSTHDNTNILNNCQTQKGNISTILSGLYQQKPNSITSDGTFEPSHSCARHHSKLTGHIYCFFAKIHLNHSSTFKHTKVHWPQYWFQCRNIQLGKIIFFVWYVFKTNFF